MARTTFRLCMAEYIPLFTLAHPNFLPASSLYNAMINEGLSTHMQVLVTQVVPNLKFPTSPMLFPPPSRPAPRLVWPWLYLLLPLTHPHIQVVALKARETKWKLPIHPMACQMPDISSYEGPAAWDFANIQCHACSPYSWPCVMILYPTLSCKITVS